MTITTRQLQNQLRALWTTADVCRVLKRTSMTVHTWRQTRGLPALEVPGSKRPAIRFVPDDVLAWAKKNDVPVYQSVERLRFNPPAVKRLTFAEQAA